MIDAVLWAMDVVIIDPDRALLATLSCRSGQLVLLQCQPMDFSPVDVLM